MGEDSQRTLQDIHEACWLLQSHVHIRNTKQVIEKINRIVRGGKDKLQVIFDFDRTLTKYHENGVPTESTYGVLESCQIFPKGFKESAQQDVNKYMAIETDPNLSVEEKIPYMLEWWSRGIERMKGIDWDPVVIDEFLKQNQQPFRESTKECFKMLSDAGVPVLVFSAGIGDVVIPLLRHQGFLTPNVHVVSNFLKIENGKINGYSNEIIHVFNKNENLIENTPYFEELAGRTNVILLGDSTGDAGMADGIPHDTVLKIGFLNTNVEGSLAQYSDVFDIVLTDDQTMEVLHQILKRTI